MKVRVPRSSCSLNSTQRELNNTMTKGSSDFSIAAGSLLNACYVKIVNEFALTHRMHISLDSRGRDEDELIFKDRERKRTKRMFHRTYQKCLRRSLHSPHRRCERPSRLLEPKSGGVSGRVFEVKFIFLFFQIQVQWMEPAAVICAMHALREDEFLCSFHLLSNCTSTCAGLELQQPNRAQNETMKREANRVCAVQCRTRERERDTRVCICVREEGAVMGRHISMLHTHTHTRLHELYSRMAAQDLLSQLQLVAIAARCTAIAAAAAARLSAEFRDANDRKTDTRFDLDTHKLVIEVAPILTRLAARTTQSHLRYQLDVPWDPETDEEPETGREELERDDTADEKPRDGDRPSAGRWCTTGADGGCVHPPQMIAVLTETIRREVGIAVAQEIAKLSRGEASADAGGASAGLGLRSSPSRDSGLTPTEDKKATEKNAAENGHGGGS
ncbi:unnamed protein product [Trichogramma brassicae]|uniref:Uncharacterized protein n=1 Tax=Trichogramma brassicae TaxID=86971 RepID=A0A6H5HVR9_9HYME|nr:unnamed protein product [Trichogramma brassicae]